MPNGSNQSIAKGQTKLGTLKKYYKDGAGGGAGRAGGTTAQKNYGTPLRGGNAVGATYAFD
jgi:hypothetical protein